MSFQSTWNSISDLIEYDAQVCLLTDWDRRPHGQDGDVIVISGKVSSLDLKGDLLVSCGLTQRMGRIYCDSVIKVWFSDIFTLNKSSGKIEFQLNLAQFANESR